MNSLRTKIVLSYSMSIFALLLMVVVAFTDIKYLQLQIVESENIRMLQSSIQQLQNQEENLLLHRAPDSGLMLYTQAGDTLATFSRYRSSFEDLGGTRELAALDTNLRRYSEIIDEMLSAEGGNLEPLEQELRNTSESIGESVFQLGLRHRLLLTKITELVSLTLAIAFSVITIIGVASAFFVIRKVIWPIRTLEQQLDAVAEGELSQLKLASRDVEIQSFVQHFNNMLARLRSQQSQLRHHEKAAALGVLVSGVAHELNNPLSNISTSVQLLLEDYDTRPELSKQWLAHIDSESERARRIVRRLLDSVRQPSKDLECISAAELVGNAVMLIHRQLDPAIIIDIEDVTEAPLNINRERFQQVFINLIRNAVDAGARNIWVFGDTTTWDDSKPDDIERVQGEVDAISKTDELLLFTVADDGPGIPEENLSQLFTPFFTTKTGGEGTGLGLYLVHEIVEEHDGCILVENRPDGGTQFLIWLPVAREEC